MHTAADTALSCGRCGTFVCGKCVVASPVGTRCRGCAPQFEHRRPAKGSDDTLFGIPFGQNARLAIVPVVLVAVVAIVGYSWLEGDRDRFIVRAIVFGGFFASTIFHEWAHSLVAYFGGDRDIRARGFLTWNPLRYMDPVLSVAMPMIFVLLGGIPLIGGRTLVDHSNLKSRWWETGVSLAGPLTNLVIAAVISAVLATGVLAWDSPVAWGLAYLAVLQISACLFNLLPVPGIDGGNAVLAHASQETQLKARMIGRAAIFLVFLAFWQVPELGSLFWDEVYRVADAFNVPVIERYLGWELARFR
jgi:Zn-dependent protease